MSRSCPAPICAESSNQLYASLISFMGYQRRRFGNSVGSIIAGKDERHVAEFLHREVLNILT